MLNPMTSNSSPSEDPGPKSKLPSSSIIAPGELWHGYGKEQELGSQNMDAGYNLEEGLRWQLAQRGTYGECWLLALIGMTPDGYCFDWSYISANRLPHGWSMKLLESESPKSGRWSGSDMTSVFLLL